MDNMITEKIKKLRAITGAGILECKKVLLDSDGSVDEAIKKMRQIGITKATKILNNSRDTHEGMITINHSNNFIVMIQINCVTDFVSRNDKFKDFCMDISNIAISKQIETLDDLLQTSYKNNFIIDDFCKTLTTEFGENIKISKLISIKSMNNLGFYLHGSKLGAIVEIKSGSVDLANDIAMHIVANDPLAISMNKLPQDILTKEKNIYIQQTNNMNISKQNIFDNIVAGKLNKFIKTNTLLEQIFVKNQNITIKELIAKDNAEIIQFHRYVLSK
jgi:elongation factor Ts